jgi:fibronectin type 3 domain-containing protein
LHYKTHMQPVPEIRFFVTAFPWRIAALIVFLLSNFLFFNASGQQTRVVAECARQSTESNPIVLIKWYSRELIYGEGVNIYRRPENSLSWTKLNATPVVKKRNVSAQALAADPDLEDFVAMVNESRPADLQEDLLMFNILVKSFQSNVFADFLGIYFEDRPALAGRYEYKVSKLKGGREVTLGTTAVINAGLYQPAPPMDSLDVFQDGKKISFNWKHEEDRYYAVNVYRKASVDATAVKLSTNPIMLSQVVDSLGKLAYPKPMFSEDRQLRENETYTYQVAGVGFFNEETQLSQPVKVRFADITPPPAPRNLLGKADSMKVILTWENVPIVDLAGMNVYRSRKSDGPYEVINKKLLPVDVMSFRDSLQLPGPYYYFISAQDTTGNEAHSNLMFVEVQDVIPPGVPEQLQLKADTGKIRLTWKMGAELDLAGYYIYRTVDSHQKSKYVLLNAEPLKADLFEQELPKNVKNEFFYYIIAVDTSYNRSKPTMPVSGKMPDILAPEKPFIKTARVEAGNIVVEWIKNVDDDLMGYHLYRADSSMTFERININLLGRETFRFVDRDQEPNTDYYYYLVALDSAGNISKPSKEKYARRSAKEVKYNKRKKHHQLSWKYDGAEEDLLGFVVYAGEDEKRLKPITGLVKDKAFTEKGSDGNRVYQVRGYVGEQVLYSSIVSY